MVLSFKDRFKKPILDGTKIHSIRKDPSNRWSRGRLIHFATGVRTKKYNCFKEDRCHSVQKLNVTWEYGEPFVHIDNYLIRGAEEELLAKNDGFDSVDDFFEWFDKDFEGKIIHWTDFKY